MDNDKTIKKDVSGIKQAKFAGLKTSPSKPTDDQLKLINQFTRMPFTADDMYVGQLRLANNAVDRDGERFSEEVLTRFAATAIRKTMLFDHGRDSQDSAAGKFFDVTIEKLPVQQANAETGENFQLPAGMNEVWFLTVSFYIPVKFVDEKVIVGIDTGIYDFSSIGFRAESMVPIQDREGKTLYWEYRGNGPRTEMTEGSLVYLGAQHGMSVKSLGATELNKDTEDAPMVTTKRSPLKPLTQSERRAEAKAKRSALAPLSFAEKRALEDEEEACPLTPKTC